MTPSNRIPPILAPTATPTTAPFESPLFVAEAIEEDLGALVEDGRVVVEADVEDGVFEGSEVAVDVALVEVELTSVVDKFDVAVERVEDA